MAASPEIKLVLATNPGSKPDVHLEGTLPAEGPEMLIVADLILQKADAMKPGIHKTAADRLATELMRRSGC